MLNFGLPPKTIDCLMTYFKSKTDIEKVLIFVSRARGNFRNWGGLDELPTPYKFDVIDYKVLSHEGMKNSIDKDGIIFYEKI